MAASGPIGQKPTEQSVDELETGPLFEVPVGWTGGETAHTGGGLWAREFLNRGEGLRVGYSAHEEHPDVYLERVEWVDHRQAWELVEIVDEVEAGHQDAEKFRTAVRLMEQA